MSDLDTFFREAPEESGSHDWLNSAYGSHGTDVPSQSQALLGFVPSAYTTHVQPDLLSYSTFGGQHYPIPAFFTEHEHSFTDRHMPSSIATGPVYVDPSYLVPSSQIQTPADSDRMSHHNFRNLCHQVPQAETEYAIGYNFSIDTPLTLNTSPRKEESQFGPVGYHNGFSPHTWFGAFEIAGPPQSIESRQPVREMQACSIQQAYIAEGAALDQQVPLADELKTTGEEDVAEYYSSWSAHDSALALNQDTEGNESEAAPRQSRPPAPDSGTNSKAKASSNIVERQLAGKGRGKECRCWVRVRSSRQIEDDRYDSMSEAAPAQGVRPDMVLAGLARRDLQCRAKWTTFCSRNRPDVMYMRERIIRRQSTKRKQENPPMR